MIDISKLTDDEIRELRKRLGVTLRAPNSKKAFGQDVIEPILRNVPAENRDINVKEQIIKTILLLADLTKGNYSYGRRHSSIGFYTWKNTNCEKRYKEFAIALAEMVSSCFTDDEM